MIKQPTVFVIGAGASCPYGFPNGRQLLRENKGQPPKELRRDAENAIGEYEAERLLQVVLACVEVRRALQRFSCVQRRCLSRSPHGRTPPSALVLNAHCPKVQ